MDKNVREKDCAYAYFMLYLINDKMCEKTHAHISKL